MASKEVKIVPASDSHIPEMIEIWIEFIDYHREIDPFFSRRDDGASNFGNHLKDLIKSDKVQVLVALDGDQVVGYSIAQTDEYPPAYQTKVYGFISDMAVKSDYRRKGIGRRLLSRIHKWFDSQGIGRIELHVVAGNRIGYTFWKKHGFQDYTHILYLNK